MKIIGVIPARFASTRFPGKPLAPIAGVPLIGHVINGAKLCKKLSDVIVATDHQEIAKTAESFGAKVVMTDPNLASGSDRVWAVAKDMDCDVVINIQGDEPLIKAEPLDLLCDAFKDPKTQIATLARKIDNVEELSNPNIAKVVVDQNMRALYFSRLPVPFTRQNWDTEKQQTGFKHIGLYAYKKDALKRFCQQKPIELELAEGLEQLRALWLGLDIQVILTKFQSWGVDQPEDVLIIEKILAKK